MNLTNPMMLCYYRSSCIDSPVALVDCKAEGFPLYLHQVFQGEYVILNYIDFDRAEQKICRDCVDEIRGQGKSETLKKVGDSTVCTGRKNQRRTKKKWRGNFLEEVAMKSVSCLLFKPMVRLVSHHLIIFSLLVHHLNLLILPFLSLGVHRIQKYFKKKRGGKQEIHQATGGEGQTQGADEANEGDSPIEVGCWLLGVGPHGIRI